MVKAYSDDLRRKVLEAHAAGEGILKELAERFRVSVGWVCKISAALGKTGKMERQPGAKRGRVSKVTPEIESFIKEGDEQLPPWFIDALADDRKSLLRSDAFRSLAFIAAIFGVLYFEVWKKFSPMGFYAFLILMITFDLSIVDKRYFTKEHYKRKT